MLMPTDDVTPIDDQLRHLLDKEAIREVILLYCRGVDRADVSLLSSAYHPDASDDHGGTTFIGEGIAPGILQLVGETRVCQHQITNYLIDLQGDNAGCETYFSAWQTIERDGQERLLHAVGRYVDRMENRNGEWRIADRVVIVELAHVLPLDSEIAPSRRSLGRRDDSDPSYAVLTLN